MLNTAVRNTGKLIRATVKEEGKRIGNRFTKKSMARLLASFSDYAERQTVRLLDAGAGTGILTAAAVEAMAEAGVKEIYADLYEIEPSYLPILETNMRRVRRKCHHDYKVRFRFRIISEDFLAAYAEERGENERYDYVFLAPDDTIMDKNDPSVSAYRTSFSVPVSRAYYFFDAALRALKDDGELIAVMPVAFATADLPEKLRAKMFSECTLMRIQLFSEKDKIRDTSGTTRDRLRSDMILHLRRGASPAEITMAGSYDFGETVHFTAVLPHSFVVRGDEKRILLFQSQKELRAVSVLESLPTTLAKEGLRMRTGLTLPSRYPELLADRPENGAIPLLSPRGIANGHIAFPIAEKQQFIIPRIPSLAQKNKNMLLLKRVPAKSDGRHLFAAVYLASQIPYATEISTQNKLIYIDFEDGREMDAPYLHGLYALFNSTTYECYCSILSKSSQVNAGEYKNLPLPDASIVRAIGRRMMTTRQFSAHVSDVLVKSALYLADEE